MHGANNSAAFIFKQCLLVCNYLILLLFQPPIASIDLRMCSNNCVDVVPRMECSRPNTFELLVKRPVAKGEVPSLLLTIEGRQAQIK